LAALVTSIAMVSCAAQPTGAKERTSMPSTSTSSLQERSIPFHDHTVIPLAEAVAAGDVARIRSLAASADLSARGKDGVTLLEWAIWNERPDALAALLDAGADASQLGMDQETVAHMAAMARDPKYLEVLIAHGAPIDIVSPRAGWTPIFRAVQSRRDPQVELLLKAGADPRRSDSMGNTLLHVAASVNDAARVLQLLAAGADAQATNARGETFQAALFSGSDARLNAQAKAERQQVRDWLAAKGIAHE
jgi:ankyrin repeat protein